MTPDGANWDPYSTHFAINEDSMIDCEGVMSPMRQRRVNTLDLFPPPVPVSDFYSIVSEVTSVTFSSDDTLIDNIFNPCGKECHTYVDRTVLDFDNVLNFQAEESKLKMSIGSTVAQSPSSSFFES